MTRFIKRLTPHASLPAGLAAIAFATLLAACTEPETVTAPTQVMLRIYNNDDALLDQMSELRIAFSLRQKTSWHTYPIKTFEKKALSWPVDIPIIATHEQDAFQQFEVVVQARSGKQALAEMRAVSSFVPGERRVLELWLYRCGGSDMPLICAAADCHGDQCQVCKTDGNCGPVGMVEGHDLPKLKEDDKTPENRPPPDNFGTGGTGATDGGMDGSDGTVPTVDCTTLTCDGNAVCVEDGGAHCECMSGYAMVDGVCEDINECKQDDRGGCSPNATCDNEVGSRVCTCKKGYEDVKNDGTECVGACELAKCAEHAECSVVAGKADCSCPSDYIGDGDTSCVFDSQCAALDCDANAECKVDGEDRKCECKPGYEGDGMTCMNPNACEPDNPCMNGGDCSDGLDDFSCDCDDGFSGDACETNKDDCAPNNPCMNSGVCMDKIDEFECDCDGTGFSGDQCQMNVDDCPSDACVDGTCADAVNNYSCVCPPGFDGTGEKACINIPDCPSGACMPGGMCMDGVQGYSCDCTVPGYMASGTTCINIDDCKPNNPCQNGGDCTDLINDHMCDCTGTGHVGKNCDEVSDGCTDAGDDCTVGTGACARPGELECADDGETLECNATPGSPSAEVCDGIDNNCISGVDEGLSDNCMSQVAYHCNGASGWQMTNCATLPGDGKTCFNNACNGVCAVNARRCEPNGGAPQLCNSSGAWADVTNPACPQPANICNKTTEMCEANDVFPFPTGHTSSSNGVSFPFSHQHLIASPIMLTEDVKLRELGLFTASDSVGGHARAAIYRDNGLAAHRPGQLYNSSATSKPLGADATALFGPDNGDLTLNANTLYWVAVVLNVDAGAGENVHLLRYEATPQANGLGGYVLSSLGWGTAFPATFPNASFFGGFEVSLFVRVQRYWH